NPGPDPAPLTAHSPRYHVLATGYALELLGAAWKHPVHAVERRSAEELYGSLYSLPWSRRAWGCGDWIDAYGTALYFNMKYFGSKQTPAALFGWLLLNADPYTGMWGAPTKEEQWLQPVNGFYRLTRGTYAQFGIPLPYPEQTID